MPIYEYACDDCGTRFEKLLRRTTEASEVRCPSCGQDHLTTQYSTFAAHNSGSKTAAAPSACEAMPSGGCCGGGMCGMNFN
jgi:putative FmdB family regulatory protein